MTGKSWHSNTKRLISGASSSIQRVFSHLTARGCFRTGFSSNTPQNIEYRNIATSNIEISKHRNYNNNMEQTMKDILNRMLNHEELTREEMKNILIGITHSEFL